MIRLITYVFLCILASLVVALPTLALADDFLSVSAPKMQLKSTLPSLNDLSIPQPAKEIQQVAPSAGTAAAFNPPPTLAQQVTAAEYTPVQAQPAVAVALALNVPVQPQVKTPVAIQPGPQAQAVALDEIPAFTVSYGDAETAVSQALTEKGVGEKISATINGRTSNPIFTYTKPLAVQIRGLNFDKTSGHWSASVLAMSGDEVISAQPAAGHFDEMAEVPVLKHAVKSGDIIAETDIAIHDYPLTHVRADTVTDIANLIGKSPLRGISPLRPIRNEEVIEPALIKKNAVISMRYTASGMEISASGQALEDGAKGSLIAVRNTVSKKVVRAVVEDATTVNVASPLSGQALNIEPTIAAGASAHATN